MAEERLYGETITFQARESTYNTDEVDLATNTSTARTYQCYTSVTVTPNGDWRPREVTGPAFGNRKGYWQPRNQTWTIEGYIPAPTTAGDEPLGLSDLLIASNCDEALVDDTTATYTLSTTATAGLSIYHYARFVDAYTWAFVYGTGIRGNTVLRGSVREICTYTFTGESAFFFDTSDTADAFHWSDDLGFIDATGDPAIGQDGSTALTAEATIDDPTPVFLEPDSVLTIDSVAFPIESFELDFGMTTKVKEATSATTQVAGVYNTGRAVTLSAVLANSGAAFEKYKDLLQANSEVSSTLVLTDGTGSGGTTITITLPKLQPTGFGDPSDSDGLVTWPLEFQANVDTSDPVFNNEMSIVWSVTS
jgi:hypothetical protein